ncbi:MAG: ATP-binding protein [Bacteroidota bacterium]
MAKQQPQIDLNIVAATPAKGFFVSNLIKDITLRDAIGDLVDNAVDAIKARANGSKSLTGYQIEIKLGKSYFSISDNGFGMEAQVARTTAFNFGKSDKHHLIDNSIGQFGIGMKRAFFKLGSIINVKSVAATSKFTLTIDVPEWLKNPKDWEFEFDKGTLEEDLKNNPNETGFSIHITNLSSDSKISFDDKTFVDILQKEIELEHMLNINKGLSIKIGEYTLESTQITLVNDDNIKPTYWEKIEKKQSVKVLAGISIKDAQDGGWYIFCNDRLVLAHDQTAQTGWGDGFAKYHAQFYRFRGYVFFEAVDSSDLPWNTTKTGMDVDSPYYKEVKSMMKTMTLQVFDLLNKLKEENEKDNPVENRKLNISVEKSIKSATPVIRILANTTRLKTKFQYPSELFNPPNKKNTVKINYTVSTEKFNAVSQHLGEDQPKDVGLSTFNYYHDNSI